MKRKGTKSFTHQQRGIKMSIFSRQDQSTPMMTTHLGLIKYETPACLYQHCSIISERAEQMTKIKDYDERCY